MIDWIIDGRDAAHPVTDQGRRRTCLSMAITGAHEHAVGSSLSSEYLHWASGRHPGGYGSPKAATEALRHNGQPPAAQWPYCRAPGASVTGGSPPATVVGPFARRNSTTRWLGFDEIVDMLREDKWPVLGLRVTDAFAARGTGIVVPDGPGRAGHAVLAVGAAVLRGHGLGPDRDEDTRLLCVRNSWGSAWGWRGHKLITETAINDTLITAFALEDGPPSDTGRAPEPCALN